MRHMNTLIMMLFFNKWDRDMDFLEKKQDATREEQRGLRFKVMHAHAPLNGEYIFKYNAINCVVWNSEK